MLDHIRCDARELAESKGASVGRTTLDALLLDNGFLAVVFYRMARWIRVRGVPFAGHLVSRMGQVLTGADISANAAIGPGFRVSHGRGLVVGGGVRLGARAHLHQNVTLGARNPQRLGSMPTLGDDVFVGAGAAILGAVVVGDGAVIGAHALVIADVPAGAIVTAPRSELRDAPERRGGELRTGPAA